jgi:hypothetical protein
MHVTPVMSSSTGYDSLPWQLALTTQLTKAVVIEVIKEAV